jgi:hypothetical protein
MRNNSAPDGGTVVVEDPNTRLKEGQEWLTRSLCCGVPATVMVGKGTEVAFWTVDDA